MVTGDAENTPSQPVARGKDACILVGSRIVPAAAERRPTCTVRLYESTGRILQVREFLSELNGFARESRGLARESWGLHVLVVHHVRAFR